MIGQTVEVCVDLETLKRMQIGHGEFREEMKSVIGRRGKVHRLTEKADVRVQFPGAPPQDHRWTINPLALKLIQGYQVGDKVTITSDKAVIAKYHQNTAALDGFSGCTGTVSLVHSETSVVVDFGGGRVGAVHPGIILPPKQQGYFTFMLYKTEHLHNFKIYILLFLGPPCMATYVVSWRVKIIHLQNICRLL